MFEFAKKKSFWFLLAVLAVFLLLMHYSTGVRNEITVAEKLLQEAVTPLQKGLNGLKKGMSKVSTGLANKQEIANQLTQMKKLNDELSLENQKLREYEAEAKRLKILLDYQQTHQEQYDMIVAEVIGRHPNNWFALITINQGARDGISPGMAVINADGLVGRISSVSYNSAQVTLITDHEMAVGAIVQNSRETQGIIEGMGEATVLRMINIPYYSKISQYERVVCSGLSQYYPKGIQIGYVQDVKKEANGLLLTATIKPAVDFNKLEEVMVITQIYPSADSDE